MQSQIQATPRCQKERIHHSLATYDNYNYDEWQWNIRDQKRV